MKLNNKIVPDLVSVLTPCFNSEQYISSLLDSVLMQDYPFIEMIVVDDGSTDNSVHVIEGYIPEFNKRGYSLSIIRQKNTGQSGAIKNGLNHIHGEYLVWPDSDDWYSTKSAISRMVAVLNSSDNSIGAVRVRAALIEESTAGEYCVVGVEGLEQNGVEDKQQIFYDCLLQKNKFYCTAGAYMVRTICLLGSMNDFYAHKEAGQNAQILLPVLYHYKCYTIPEIHYNVRVHQDSHSRKDKNDLERMLRRFDIYRMTYLATLENITDISSNDFHECRMRVNHNMDYSNFWFSCFMCDKSQAKKAFIKLQNQNVAISFKHKVIYYLLQMGILPVIQRIRRG